MQCKLTIEEIDMSAQGLEHLDHTVQLTHVWINDLDGRLSGMTKRAAIAC